MTKPNAPIRADFAWATSITTRWMDNDVYGHINNVAYYSFFDTAINVYLIDQGGLDINDAAAIGVALETGCRFHRSLSFPQVIEAGLRVSRLGTSSVRYEVGLFGRDDDTAAAEGHFVHVFIDRNSRRPIPIPATIREALSRILVK